MAKHTTTFDMPGAQAQRVLAAFSADLAVEGEPAPTTAEVKAYIDDWLLLQLKRKTQAYERAAASVPVDITADPQL